MPNPHMEDISRAFSRRGQTGAYFYARALFAEIGSRSRFLGCRKRDRAQESNLRHLDRARA